jgi:ribosome recycling factor
MNSIPEQLKHARELMTKAVENTRREFSSIRTGKATPTLLDTVRVDAYGNMMPLNQVALVAAPEPRMLTVQPFDKGLSQMIEKAIRDSELGLNPASQGGLIRVPIPALTEQRRKDMVKMMHKLGEEGKVAVRHARGDAHTRIKKVDKVPEDDKTRGEKELQKFTDDHIKQIDQLIAAKEAEIMEV